MCEDRKDAEPLLKILRHPCMEGIVSLNFNKPKMQDCLRNLLFQLMCVLKLKFAAYKKKQRQVKQIQKKEGNIFCVSFTKFISLIVHVQGFSLAHQLLLTRHVLNPLSAMRMNWS